MAVMMRVGRYKAFLRRGEWRCASAELEAKLNQFTKKWVQRDASREELSQELEHAIAEAVSRQFGGKLLLQSDPQNRRVKDSYFRLRQLDLFQI